METIGDVRAAARDLLRDGFLGSFFFGISHGEAALLARGRVRRGSSGGCLPSPTPPEACGLRLRADGERPREVIAPADSRSRAKRVARPEGRRPRCAQAAAAGGAIDP
jgi:hypothetical protein